jgi:hypothetical protein
MLRSLIAYNAAGEVVGTLDQLVRYDDEGDVLGVVDFEAQESAGRKLRDVWEVSTAVGSATWPEWLGAKAHNFTVELDADKRIKALVHKDSGHRRERADIEAAIQGRINDKKAEAKKRGDDMRKDAKAKGLPRNVVDAMPDPEPEPADLRDLVGGPDRPLLLDEDGHTKPKAAKSQKPSLPVISVGKG